MNKKPQKANPLVTLQNVLSLLKANKIGPTREQALKGDKDCMYTYPNKNCCVVGAMFTDAQRQDIMNRGLNAHSVFGLKNHIGRENLEFVTGLTHNELDALQGIHDSLVRQQAHGTSNNKDFRQNFNRLLTERLEAIIKTGYTPNGVYAFPSVLAELEKQRRKEVRSAKQQKKTS